MRFNLILLQMLSSDPRIFLAQANANDGKLESQTFGPTKRRRKQMVADRGATIPTKCLFRNHETHETHEIWEISDPVS